MTARLFPDFAAAPTRTERAEARRINTAGQGSLFDAATSTPTACPVCASTSHTARHCPHGTAPTLPLDAEPAWEYPTPEACAADNSWSSGAVTRTLVLTGSTKCDQCPGDLTDEWHWNDPDLDGKNQPFTSPDMFTAADIAALGPRKGSPLAPWQGLRGGHVVETFPDRWAAEAALRAYRVESIRPA